MSLKLTLTQTKLYSGASPRTERFTVTHQLVSSVPTEGELEAAFILQVASGVDRERLIRILNLSAALDAALVADPASVNPLTYFRDGALDLAEEVSPGDTLRVIGSPGEWGPADNAAFTIASVDDVTQRIAVTEPFPWSAQGLTYRVRDPADTYDVVPQRTGGFTERVNTGLSEWRTDRFTAGFATSAEALSHIVWVQAHVASLAKQAQLDVAEYLAAGGNPITNVY